MIALSSAVNPPYKIFKIGDPTVSPLAGAQKQTAVASGLANRADKTNFDRLRRHLGRSGGWVMNLGRYGKRTMNRHIAVRMRYRKRLRKTTKMTD